MPSYIGVDPGVNGGLVELRENGALLRVDRMPPTDTDIWEWMKRAWAWAGSFAVIESIPPAIGISFKNKKGVKQTSSKGSMSKLYGSYRSLRMALVAAGITVEEVKLGEVWRAFGIAPKGKTETKSQWKGRIKAKAASIFTTERVTLAVCDALLFAEYGRRSSQGLLVAKATPFHSASQREL